MPQIEYVRSRPGGFAVITFDEDEYDQVESILAKLKEYSADLYPMRAWVTVSSKTQFTMFEKEFMKYFSKYADVEVL